METLRPLCLARSIYHEVILEGNPSRARADVQNFVQVLEWIAAERITQIEFDALYDAWRSSGTVTPSAPSVIPEFEFTSLLAARTESELDLMLSALITSFNGRLLREVNISQSWIRVAESLFFCLDARGYGYVSVDEVQFLILALLGSEDLQWTPRKLLRLAADFMADAGAVQGVLTLNRFKSYFLNNKLDEMTLETTLQKLSQESTRWASLNDDPSNDLVVPRLWERAVQGGASYVGRELRDRLLEIDVYLWCQTNDLRCAFVEEEQQWRLSLEMFRRYGQTHSELLGLRTEEEILRSAEFVQIQHTLLLYGEYLTQAINLFLQPVKAASVRHVKTSSFSADSQRQSLQATSQPQPQSSSRSQSPLQHSPPHAYYQVPPASLVQSPIQPAQSSQSGLEKNSREQALDPLSRDTREEETMTSLVNDSVRHAHVKLTNIASPERGFQESIVVDASSIAPSHPEPFSPSNDFPTVVIDDPVPEAAEVDRMVRNAEWVDIRSSDVSSSLSPGALPLPSTGDQDALSQTQSPPASATSAALSPLSVNKSLPEASPVQTSAVLSASTANSGPSNAVSGASASQEQVPPSWVENLTKSIIDGLIEHQRKLSESFGAYGSSRFSESGGPSPSVVPAPIFTPRSMMQPSPISSSIPPDLLAQSYESAMNRLASMNVAAFPPFVQPQEDTPEAELRSLLDAHGSTDADSGVPAVDAITPNYLKSVLRTMGKGGDQASEPIRPSSLASVPHVSQPPRTTASNAQGSFGNHRSSIERRRPDSSSSYTEVLDNEMNNGRPRPVIARGNPPKPIVTAQARPGRAPAGENK